MVTRRGLGLGLLLLAGCGEPSGPVGREVAAVRVTPESAVLLPGASTTLQAVALDARGDTLRGIAFQWSSSAAATSLIVLDSTRRRVSAIRPGTDTVVVVAAGQSARATIRVDSLVAVSVSILGGDVTAGRWDSTLLRIESRAADGRVLTGRPVTWAVSDTALLAVSPQGWLVGRAVGAAEVMVRVDSAADTVAVLVTPAPAVRLELSPGSAALPVGQSLALSVVAIDRKGFPTDTVGLGLSVLDPSTLDLGAGAVVTGLAPGIGRVRATLGPVSDTTRISVVNGGLSLQTSAQELRAGDTLLVRGGGLTGAAAVIRSGLAGRADAVPAFAAQGDSVLSIVIPSSLFAPCLRAGVVDTIEVGVGAQVGRLALPSHPAAYPLDLAPGEHLYPAVPSALACPVQLGAGTYVLMPFQWDRPPSPVVAEDTIPVRIASAPVDGLPGPVPVGLRRPPARSAAPATDVRLAPAGPGGPLRPARLTDPACTLPTTIGDSVPIGTARDASGRVAGLGGPSLEHWRVVAVSTHLVVLVDSSSHNPSSGGLEFVARLREVVDSFESIAAPTFDGPLGGVPNSGGYGRLPMLVTAASGIQLGGLAFAGTYLRGDCVSPTPPGETIWLNGVRMLPSNLWNAAAVEQVLSVVVHEVAHIVDLSPARQPQGFTGRPWVWEGFATLVQHIVANRGYPNPLTAQLIADLVGCVPQRPLVRTFSFRWVTFSYVGACHAVGRTFAYHGGGGALGPLFARWAGLADRSSFPAISAGMSPGPVSARDAFGEYALSWYADDYVVGTAPGLQDPMFGFGHSGNPWADQRLPDLALLHRHGGIDAQLLEPDALMAEVTFDAPFWVYVTRQDGTPIPSGHADVAVLRVR